LLTARISKHGFWVADMLINSLKYLFPGFDPLRDAELRGDGGEPVIHAWYRAEPQPTAEELEAVRVVAEAAAARAAMPSMTPAQLDLALLQFGLLDAVEAFVAAADRPTQIAYKRVQMFQRNNPLLNTAAGLLGMTDEQIDAVWMYGAALRPGE
jgi:hypothetical protein